MEMKMTMKSTLTSALTAVALVVCNAGTGIAHQKDRVEINGAATNTASSGEIRGASRFLSSDCKKGGCYVVAGSRNG
jgi:hypothetical protein